MLDRKALYGIVPPIPTPLTPEGDVDHSSLARLVDFMIQEGVHGIWTMGTTGEFAAFSPAERAAASATVVQAARRRVPVIVNVGDCNTKAAVANARAAQAAGADALALLSPYYYANNQVELLDHFRAVKAASDLPLLAYHIPQTVKVVLAVPTLLTLAEENTIVGLKDSSSDMFSFRDLVISAKQKGIDLRAFLGNGNFIDLGNLGGVGSVSGNLLPALTVRCFAAASRGDTAEASSLQAKLFAANRVLRLPLDGSPFANSVGALKTVLKHLGVISCSRMAAPQRSLTPEDEARVIQAYEALGVAQPVA